MITAAHCTHSYPADVWTVSIGDQNSHDQDEEHQQLVAVDSIVPHPLYAFPKYNHDIAVMRLARPVEWSQYAQPICLPDAGARTGGRGLGYLAGWGYDK